MIGAGKLDRAIDLQTYQETGRNSLNEPVSEWVTTGAKVPAQLLLMTSSERITAGQTLAAKTRVFIIRYREGVTPGEGQALVFEGSRYDITAVDPVEGRKVGLRITAVGRAE